MTHDSRYMADIGYGCHDSPISDVAMPLSFCFVSLFCQAKGESDRFDRSLSAAELETNATSSCVVDSFLRNENFEADLIAALEATGVQLMDEDRHKILLAGKTNTPSKRKKAAGILRRRHRGLGPAA